MVSMVFRGQVEADRPGRGKREAVERGRKGRETR
jgi:hypothetical protein